MQPYIYFFGELPNGFDAIPNDSNSELFKQMLAKARNKVQIMFHRDDKIAQYVYIRRVNSKSRIGICLCIDGLYLNVDKLFVLFDRVFATLIEKGELLKITSGKEFGWTADRLFDENVALNEFAYNLVRLIKKKDCVPLPPQNFSIAKDAWLEISLEEGNPAILDAQKRYTNIYIAKKEADIARISSFLNLLKSENQKRKELQKQVDDLKKRNAQILIRQKNLKIVSFLTIVIAIMLGILWQKVLFPKEVTRKDMGSYVYYGPMKNNKPNGVGVAIYRDNDKDGRLYYYGKFVNGEREDSTAIMFYNDGSYFRGIMKDNKWVKGLFYDTENEHFVGEFKDNQPCKGVWYKHEPVQTINGDEK